MAVNPCGPSLSGALKAADCIPLETTQELCGIAYSIVEEPEKIQFADYIIGIIEVRDDTITDMIHQLKPFEFAK